MFALIYPLVDPPPPPPIVVSVAQRHATPAQFATAPFTQREANETCRVAVLNVALRDRNAGAVCVELSQPYRWRAFVRQPAIISGRRVVQTIPVTIVVRRNGTYVIL